MTYRDAPENVFKQLIDQYKDKYQISIGFNQEVTKEETDVEKAVRQLALDNNVQIKEYWTTTLYHPDDLPFNNPKAFPHVFTHFRTALEKQGVRVRRLINTPTTFKPIPDGTVPNAIPSLLGFGYPSTKKTWICFGLLLFVLDMTAHSKSVFSFEGGESSGLEHLQNYIWNKNLARTYKQTRNSLTGSENSTKFSPWLSNGSLSPRQVFFELKRYENEQAASDAGYWIIFELLWRDFFKFIAMKYGNRIFYARGLRSEPYVWKQNLQQFEAWKSTRSEKHDLLVRDCLVYFQRDIQVFHLSMQTCERLCRRVGCPIEDDRM